MARVRYDPLTMTPEKLAECQTNLIKALGHPDVKIPFEIACDIGEFMDYIYQVANFGMDQIKAINAQRAALTKEKSNVGNDESKPGSGN